MFYWSGEQFGKVDIVRPDRSHSLHGAPHGHDQLSVRTLPGQLLIGQKIGKLFESRILVIQPDKERLFKQMLLVLLLLQPVGGCFSSGIDFLRGKRRDKSLQVLFRLFPGKLFV